MHKSIQRVREKITPQTVLDRNVRSQRTLKKLRTLDYECIPRSTAKFS